MTFMQPTTLCFLIKEDKILLAMKKRGFGIGKWNGVGGKVQKKETIKEAVIRETEEEIGVIINSEHLENVGSIKFYFNHKPEWNKHMHIFFARKWAREPKESEEMKPKWYTREKIPYKKMWSDDEYWIPKVLAGKKIEGEFYFRPDGNTFDKYKIKEI